ncbi:SUMF1/EgtB/PvdO family nonheme iron enzyme [Tuwongella immobilis]|uniref:Sulfatase-modifying factor enzyme-like domain-containing protein n=1 Tax=Tuwongella immobilis TaxID=692036 RepID=A0A6C2YPY2_9BACT|nr:SUMF1/EgtB/PvdO family nonheme iron enzyme [Tuwongella immobilis]VIP03239.1 serine threonine protein kinase : Sulphatase-modifying factor protein OS=Planctomyces brasiliensis (strain ATCC 49424 / DSM 5305 / JCM 21570 / NBRC 103401 / IFAM 1448) GN=Plabr_2026 PE=4 SV=1: FGE-sulfatase [Tuwongella immobilis]VTS03804.1 serine threonine protein kinase : Sulphatase-modifying factor protein OS=Planctomyces brasiliensis (strain ATCC 49424 / DSM 5305 / JCM 21570 / NBRC 103401 / IFAM 1448) GN=Plabr_2026 
MLEPLLKSIQASPSSLDNRLVLADWLEEHDDPRATWFRASCELSIWRENPLESAPIRQLEAQSWRQLRAGWLQSLTHSTRFLRGRSGLLEVWANQQALRGIFSQPDLAPWIASLRIFGAFELILEELTPPLTHSLHTLDLRNLAIGPVEFEELCQRIDSLGEDWQIRGLDLRGSLLDSAAWSVIQSHRFAESMQWIRFDDGVCPIYRADSSKSAPTNRSRTLPEWMQGYLPSPNSYSGKELVNSLGMRFVRVPAGRFVMGSPIVERNHEQDEHLHPVHLTRSFYIGETAVTQHVYQTVMRDNPSRFLETLNSGCRPVDCVSWFDAERFCEELSALPDEKSAGRRYRLPTEAEWEYACRAGTTTPFAFGEQLSPALANYGSMIGSTTPVGIYPGNDFGVYDMHGGIREWCADRYAANYYLESPLENPPGPESGRDRVLRGGSWEVAEDHCRSAYRLYYMVDSHLSGIGFRVVCETVNPS